MPTTRKLLPFDAEQARRGAYARADRGLRTIEVVRVVGSVGRTAEFDHRFKYRRGRAPGDAEGRLRRLRALFEAGRVPPLDLYQIGDDLFVLDGHHRVAVARERGQLEIEAHVVEYVPDRNDPANAVHHERRAFVAATGLGDVHATEPGRYPRLLNRIRDHRHELVLATRGAPRPTLSPLAASLPDPLPDMREAARGWYAQEYVLVARVLTARGIARRFPERALGDLYGYVCDHRWYLSERRGWDVGIDAALGDFVRQHAPESTVASVVALGSEMLDRAPGPLRRAQRHAAVAFACGLLALPLARLRELWRLRDRLPGATPSG
ncbi:MAG TPA: DUF4032 domain-containing protein [Chloroflexota bacterium]|nr:DUF4032 domain-containing protein [Chloroflexota bacterium]